MINIYIGFDRKETIAYHVLAHSIIKRASIPVSITPLCRDNLKDYYWRPRGEYDSTDFSNSRWIVPFLQKYKGWAIFMDCDMLCLGDIAELYDQRNSRYSVMVKKHNHVPKEDIKFLGQRQTQYERKNWSSLMMFNCGQCRPLTQHIVNTKTPGLWFHRMEWTPDDTIGEINGPWNLLVGYDDYRPDAKLVHYTSLGPWHDPKRTANIDYRREWELELADLIGGENPYAKGSVQEFAGSLLVEDRKDGDVLDLAGGKLG